MAYYRAEIIKYFGISSHKLVTRVLNADFTCRVIFTCNGRLQRYWDGQGDPVAVGYNRQFRIDERKGVT
jgi:hypothetical protein